MTITAVIGNSSRFYILRVDGSHQNEIVWCVCTQGHIEHKIDRLSMDGAKMRIDCLALSIKRQSKQTIERRQKTELDSRAAAIEFPVACILNKQLAAVQARSSYDPIKIHLYTISYLRHDDN